jgi:hypothetical protein
MGANATVERSSVVAKLDGKIGRRENECVSFIDDLPCAGGCGTPPPEIMRQ